jgi:molybdenum cofactor cytidylyltransferase
MNELFGVVILAAGRSTRMGRPKLLLPWGCTSIIGHLIGVWQGLGAQQIAVILAVDDSNLASELDRLEAQSVPPGRLTRIANPAPDRGMFSSIQCAAKWPGWHNRLTHWAIALGDQPHLRSETLARLIEMAGVYPTEICQPMCEGRLRHPVLLPGPVFVELAGSKAGDLREFLSGREVKGFAAEDPGLYLDIDRPEDYRKALALAGLAPRF